MSAALTLAAVTQPALASDSPCVLHPHDSSCGFDTTLHILRILAVVLGIALIAIAAVAIAIYRKNRNKKLTPND